MSEVELNFIARAVIKAAQIFLFRAIFSLKLDKMKLRLNRVEIAFATKNPFSMRDVTVMVKDVIFPMKNDEFRPACDNFFRE